MRTPKLVEFVPFKRLNLYKVSCGEYFRCSSKILNWNKMFCSLLNTTSGTQFQYFYNNIWLFYQDQLFDIGFRASKEPYIPKHTTWKLYWTKIWNFYHKYFMISYQDPKKNSIWKFSEKMYSENAKLTHLKESNLMIIFFITKCYARNNQIT